MGLPGYRMMTKAFLGMLLQKGRACTPHKRASVGKFDHEVASRGEAAFPSPDFE